jgi:hypothetical protein
MINKGGRTDPKQDPQQVPSLMGRETGFGRLSCVLPAGEKFFRNPGHPETFMGKILTREKGENFPKKILPFCMREKREKISQRKFSLFVCERKGRKFSKENSPFLYAREKGENFPKKILPFLRAKKREKISQRKISLLELEPFKRTGLAISEGNSYLEEHSTKRRSTPIRCRQLFFQQVTYCSRVPGQGFKEFGPSVAAEGRPQYLLKLNGF